MNSFKYDLAMPAALQALRFSMSLSGQNSIDLVPSYLLLGKASIGLKKYNQAEEYLTLAKWAILKVSDCHPGMRGLLHRNIGLLNFSRGNYEDALQHLSLDVYYHSIAYNPEHISVSGGYYQLGNVFFKQTKMELVTAFYDKVVSIWKMTLIRPHEKFGERL
jgi:tetratricopeptide (TPR) repeat protein